MTSDNNTRLKLGAQKYKRIGGRIEMQRDTSLDVYLDLKWIRELILAEGNEFLRDLSVKGGLLKKDVTRFVYLVMYLLIRESHDQGETYRSVYKKYKLIEAGITAGNQGRADNSMVDDLVITNKKRMKKDEFWALYSEEISQLKDLRDVIDFMSTKYVSKHSFDQLEMYLKSMYI
ncbi:MAG: hypothetical protein RRZ84_07305 [Romboutsia sp.]